MRMCVSEEERRREETNKYITTQSHDTTTTRKKTFMESMFWGGFLGVLFWMSTGVRGENM